MTVMILAPVAIATAALLGESNAIFALPLPKRKFDVAVHNTLNFLSTSVHPF